jgi:hypothetical protein
MDYLCSKRLIVSASQIRPLNKLTMEGWISLHRSIKEHWIWKDPEKLKWWIDILLSVNHVDAKVVIGSRIFECKRGQSLNSLDTWAKRWNTNRSKVKRFLDMLKIDTMIETQSLHTTTLLTVCKYDSYQNNKNESETQVKHKWNTSETEVNTNNNKDNKDNSKDINILTVDVQNYVDHFNFLFNSKYKPNQSINKYLKHWLKTYSMDEIKEALTLSTKIDSFEAKICRTEPIKLLRMSNSNGAVDYIGNLLNTKTTSNQGISIKHCREKMNEATEQFLINKHNLPKDFFTWPLNDRLTELTVLKLTPFFVNK